MGALSDVMSIIEKSKFYQNFKKTKSKVIELEKRINEFENKFNTSSDSKCPACGAYQFFVIETNPHPSRGAAAIGLVLRKYQCKKCKFEETKTFSTNR